MKKIIILAGLLLLSTITTAQEYLKEVYTEVIVENGDRHRDKIIVEYNTFKTTDIVIKFGNREPVRYVQVEGVVEGEYESVTYQSVRMKISGTERLVDFILFETGELMLHSLESKQSILFIKKIQARTKKL